MGVIMGWGKDRSVKLGKCVEEVGGSERMERGWERRRGRRSKKRMKNKNRR